MPRDSSAAGPDSAVGRSGQGPPQRGGWQWPPGPRGTLIGPCGPEVGRSSLVMPATRWRSTGSHPTERLGSSLPVPAPTQGRAELRQKRDEFGRKIPMRRAGPWARAFGAAIPLYSTGGAPSGSIQHPHESAGIHPHPDKELEALEPAAMPGRRALGGRGLGRGFAEPMTGGGRRGGRGEGSSIRIQRHVAEKEELGAG